jgi:hypothetical protein
MIKKFIDKLLGKSTPGTSGGKPHFGKREEVPATVHGIDPELVDRRAAEVVATLKQAGYEAYIVGGAVRDLLLGLRPKDFDVATNATPEQVKGLFRRAFIIGKRFRIVHVERAGLVVGIELVVAARKLHRVVPADANGEFAPLVVGVQGQQRVVEVEQRKPHTAGIRGHSGSQKAKGARLHSDSSIVLSNGIVIARWVRSANASSWSSNNIRLPRSREKRLSM